MLDKYAGMSLSEMFLELTLETLNAGGNPFDSLKQIYAPKSKCRQSFDRLRGLVHNQSVSEEIRERFNRAENLFTQLTGSLEKGDDNPSGLFGQMRGELLAIHQLISASSE